MKHCIQMGLLKQVDEITEERIAEQFPAAWDMESIYHRSMQKYLQKSEDTPIRVSRHRRMPYHWIGTAACLLLIVGLGVGVWSKQQRIEVQPEEPPAAPTSEHATEPSRETETTGQTAEAAAPTEATTALVQDATEPRTAVIPTEAAETKPASTQPETSPEPAATAAPVIVPVATDAPTEAPTAAPTAAPTEEIPEIADNWLTGFRVEQYTAYRKIISTDAFPAPNGELRAYSVEGDALELIGTSDETAAAPVRSYDIRDPETGKVFTVTQQEYAEFVLTVEEGELIDIGISRVHGFFLLQETSCTVYWFCDGEGFCVSGDIADLQSFLEIVRSFQPAKA